MTPVLAPRRLGLVSLAAAGLIAALAGCGGGGDKARSDAEPTSTPQATPAQIASVIAARGPSLRSAIASDQQARQRSYNRSSLGVTFALNDVDKAAKATLADLQALPSPPAEVSVLFGQTEQALLELKAAVDTYFKCRGGSAPDTCDDTLAELTTLENELVLRLDGWRPYGA